jgi:hypothetical protein
MSYSFPRIKIVDWYNIIIMSVGLNLFYDNLCRFCIVYLILCL